MKKKVSVLLGIFIVIAFLASPIFAIPILINNPSFEADVAPSGPPYGDFGDWIMWPPYSDSRNIITGWTISLAAGVFHPNLNALPSELSLYYLPDGINSAYIDHGYIQQTTTHYLMAGETYNLSVHVGRRLEWPMIPNFPGYEIALLSGNTVLTTYATGSYPDDISPGFWVERNLTYTAKDSDPMDLISVRLRTYDVQTNFDLVSLDYTPVPLPAGILLLGSGLLGLPLLRFCKTRKF